MSPFLISAIGVAIAAVLVLACLHLARWVAEEPTSCGPRWRGVVAKRLDASDGGDPSLLEFELVTPSTLRDGDLVACWAGDAVPGRSIAIEGSAVVTPSSFLRAGGRVVARGDGVPGGLYVTRGYLILRLADGIDPSSHDAIPVPGPHPRIARQPASAACACRS
jgi:hypothetical protein